MKQGNTTAKRIRNAAIVAVMSALTAVSAVQGQCTAWSASANIGQTPGRHPVDPHMDIDANGNVHVVYQDFVSGDNRYFYTMYDGSNWSTPEMILWTGNKGVDPKIAVTPDNVVHAFIGYGQIYHMYKPIGGAWSSPALLTVAANGGTKWIEGVCVDSFGGMYFAYGNLFDGGTSPRNGLWGRYKPLGGAWGGTEFIVGGSDDQDWPAGRLLIDNSTYYSVYYYKGYERYKARAYNGAWTGGDGYILLADGSGAVVDWSTANPGEAAMVYARDYGHDGADLWLEIEVMFTYDYGVSWTTPVNISQATGLDRIVSGTYDANGNFHVVWEGPGANGLHTWYRGYVGGGWTAKQILSPDRRVEHPGEAIQTYNGKLYAIYTADDSGGLGWGVYFNETSYPTSPMINVNTNYLTHSVWIRQGLANDTLTVGNRCAGTLNYTVTPTAGWVAVSPNSGSSALDVDGLTVSYPGVPSLNAGLHQAYLIVEGDGANSPQYVLVTVTVSTVQADLDGDADVDQDDFGFFQRCMTGQAVPQTDPACAGAKLDGDEDVDSFDLEILQGCLSGHGIPANPGCM